MCCGKGKTRENEKRGEREGGMGRREEKEAEGGKVWAGEKGRRRKGDKRKEGGWDDVIIVHDV